MLRARFRVAAVLSAIFSVCAAIVGVVPAAMAAPTSADWPSVGATMSIECGETSASLRGDFTVGEGIPVTLKLSAYAQGPGGNIDPALDGRFATRRVTSAGDYTLRIDLGSWDAIVAFAGYQPDGSGDTVYGGDRDFRIPEDCPGRFADVPADYQFYEAIAWMSERGITTGYETPSGREYRPWGNVTRDAMAAFLYRYAGSPNFTLPPESPFVDVKPTNNFYREIAWLASTGVSTGWESTAGREYRPYAPITRDAMAAFLYRFKNASFEPSGQPVFRDVPASGQFFREIAWLNSTGISTGWEVQGGREYRPFANITRDAMAAFLYRFDSKK